MQFEIGMSTRRYLPPSGTAGLARSLVRGNSRVPAPPPMTMVRTVLVFGDMRAEPGVETIRPPLGRNSTVFSGDSIPAPGGPAEVSRRGPVCPVRQTRPDARSIQSLRVPADGIQQKPVQDPAHDRDDERAEE